MADLLYFLDELLIICFSSLALLLCYAFVIKHRKYFSFIQLLISLYLINHSILIFIAKEIVYCYFVVLNCSYKLLFYLIFLIIMLKLTHLEHHILFFLYYVNLFITSLEIHILHLDYSILLLYG